MLVNNASPRLLPNPTARTNTTPLHLLAGADPLNLLDSSASGGGVLGTDPATLVAAQRSIARQRAVDAKVKTAKDGRMIIVRSCALSVACVCVPICVDSACAHPAVACGVGVLSD